MISLMGFMGSGKSTFGKRVAKHFGWKFIDLDHYIEGKEEHSINEIFAQCGEEHFRSLERKYLGEIINKNEDILLSLGGGTPCNDEIWDLLKETASVYLKRTPLFLYRILKAKKSKRPLIKDLSDHELEIFIKNKLESRASYYMRADVIFHAYGSMISIEKRLVDKIHKSIS